MKTRNGFVSNSSSSSFIVVVTEDAFQEALKHCKSEDERKLLMVIATDEVCLGQKVKMVKEFTDAGGMSSIWGYDGEFRDEILEKAGIKIDYDEDIDESSYEWVDEAVYHYCEIIDKLKKKKEWKSKIFTTDVGDGG